MIDGGRRGNSKHRSAARYRADCDSSSSPIQLHQQWKPTVINHGDPTTKLSLFEVLLIPYRNTSTAMICVFTRSSCSIRRCMKAIGCRRRVGRN